jgi:hypothetical protein
MNFHQFNDAWEKLRRAPVKAKVLQLLLDGQTNAEIARLRGRAEGTIRKQISVIYKDFGIRGESPGDEPLRDELKALFRKYKPEWITNYPSTSTNQISEEGQQKENENDRDKPPLLSPRTQDEDLMSLATRLLQKLGFDQKFKVTKGFQYIGYRFKNPEKRANPYQLILSQQQEGLYISIPQYILEPYLLTLKYWTNDLETGNPEENTAGKFLVLPLKRDIFLDSLHPHYWNILEVERKTIGTFYLNEFEKIYYEEYEDFDYYNACSSICLQEFNPNNLSDSNSYLLVLGEDELFSYTWQICISSHEVLQEFIDHFGEILILDADRPYRDLDDIPF